MSIDDTSGKTETTVEQTNRGMKRRDLLLSGSSLVAASALSAVGLTSSAQAQQPTAAPATAGQRPNILVIMGDDIGLLEHQRLQSRHDGLRTPNIDRSPTKARYSPTTIGQQSCTAGRANFITGKSIANRAAQGRSGLRHRGLFRRKDPPSPSPRSRNGYATGQFGKNHLGDRTNSCLPCTASMNSSATFIISNAEDEPEHPDYPQEPGFRAQFGPRGVMKCLSPSRPTRRRRSPLRDMGQTKMSKIPDHSPRNAWRRSTRNSLAPRRFIERQIATKSRSSCGSTRAACTSGPASSRNPRVTRTAGIYPDGHGGASTARSGMSSRS